MTDKELRLKVKHCIIAAHGDINGTDARGYDTTSYITSIAVSHNALSDEAMDVICTLPTLQALYCTGCKLTEASLVKIVSSTKLTTLCLDQMELDSGSVQYLNNPNLEWLDISNTLVDDEAMKAIARCDALMSLRMEGTRITDTGLHELAKLQNLTFLNVSNTAIRGEGVVHLSSLPLNELLLNSTKLDDSCVECFRHFSDFSLITIWLEGTDVSEGAASRIREFMPLAEIVI